VLLITQSKYIFRWFNIIPNEYGLDIIKKKSKGNNGFWNILFFVTSLNETKTGCDFPLRSNITKDFCVEVFTNIDTEKEEETELAQIKEI